MSKNIQEVVAIIDRSSSMMGKEEITINSYEISEELKNKINFLYKEDFKLYNNVQNSNTCNRIKEECCS